MNILGRPAQQGLQSEFRQKGMTNEGAWLAVPGALAVAQRAQPDTQAADSLSWLLVPGGLCQG